MGSIKGFFDWVKGEEVIDEPEDDQETRSRERETRQKDRETRQRSDSAPSSSSSSYDTLSDTPSTSRRSGGKVVNINSSAKLAVVVVRPSRFENAAEIADHLKDKRTVVINLQETAKDIARRLVDFLSGVAYAQEGKIQKIANDTFIITPYNVDIIGDLIDELGNSGVYF